MDFPVIKEFIILFNITAIPKPRHVSTLSLIYYFFSPYAARTFMALKENSLRKTISTGFVFLMRLVKSYKFLLEQKTLNLNYLSISTKVLAAMRFSSTFILGMPYGMGMTWVPLSGSTLDDFFMYFLSYFFHAL